MATKTKAPSDEAIAAYEEAVKSSHRVSVTETLAVRALFRKYEYTYVDGANGNSPVEKVDNDGIKKGIFDIAGEHIVGASKEDRITIPIHRYEVTGKLLADEPVPPPHGDPDQWDAQDALTRAVWHKAEQHCWKLIDHKFNGTLQRWVRDSDELDDGLVLVKAGDYLFLTAEPKYIEADVFAPMTDKAVIAMVSAGEQFGLFTRQNPALKARARSALKKATKQAGDKALAAYTLRAEENGEEE
jgi:hypothetical protein